MVSLNTLNDLKVKLMGEKDLYLKTNYQNTHFQKVIFKIINLERYFMESFFKILRIVL
ncbi:unnamed protein product [Paramecium sonneborni]|uniref:Uncharacterized protein n=1 Tax=Paramecium sonneborni TaxID=65129 RepID=A0A8S1M2R7_9CILI|nr:unnamed protein product [Paramecium sonneborni]CAD8069264.1 unnamed protein product [Paramecium sonneborni]